MDVMQLTARGHLHAIAGALNDRSIRSFSAPTFMLLTPETQPASTCRPCWTPVPNSALRVRL